MGGAGGGAPIDDPTTSRRGLAPLGGVLKRRQLANAAAYAEDEPHVTDSALESLFEALYANGGAAAAAAAALLSSSTSARGHVAP